MPIYLLSSPTLIILYHAINHNHTLTCYIMMHQWATYVTSGNPNKSFENIADLILCRHCIFMLGNAAWFPANEHSPQRRGNVIDSSLFHSERGHLAQVRCRLPSTVITTALTWIQYRVVRPSKEQASIEARLKRTGHMTPPPSYVVPTRTNRPNFQWPG